MNAQTMRIDHLKRTIDRNEYSVDADKVAEAIVALLLARRAGPRHAQRS